MDHIKIGRHAIVAAGTVIPGYTIIPPGIIFAGIPARQNGTVTEDQIKTLHDASRLCGFDREILVYRQRSRFSSSMLPSKNIPAIFLK